ncbi:uncharacterized protein DS421_3g103310 [Arachis hypogaea]|nr:uncharacterized protein DS421_3g103310 [Arachis hypogaea]
MATLTCCVERIGRCCDSLWVGWYCDSVSRAMYGEGDRSGRVVAAMQRRRISEKGDDRRAHEGDTNLKTQERRVWRWRESGPSEDGGMAVVTGSMAEEKNLERGRRLTKKEEEVEKGVRIGLR